MQISSLNAAKDRASNAGAISLITGLLVACIALGACGNGSSSASAAAADGDRAKATPADRALDPQKPAGGAARAAAGVARSGNSAAVHTLTGTHTRVVWVQGDGTDPYAAGQALVLKGLDTDDGKGERVIVGERGSFTKPMLIGHGDRIVYSSHAKDPADVKVFVVNFDGSGLKQIATGFALAVWAEPASGRDWVYLGTDNTAKSPYDFHTVSRFPVDRPEAREVVWNKTLVSGDTFQVSADGRTAGGLFPWPQAGVASLPNGALRLFGEGCWTAFRDAGPGLFWYFDGSHRNVNIVDRATDRKWLVPLNQAPGFNNPEVYHPRWANHPRFVAISGPYNQGGQNQVRSGGKQAEIYLGRFSADYTKIEAWARVTDNVAGDSYPDAWIDLARNPHAIALASSAASPDKKPAAPAARKPLVVEARLAALAAIPTPRSIAPYRNALVVNVYDVVKVIDGDYKEQRVLVAQWGIRDAKVLDEARQRVIGSTARLTLERYDDHPELEGERVIAASGGPNLPMYYDVTARP